MKHSAQIKLVATFVLLVSTHFARAAFFTNNVSADAFVRSNAPTSNYGAAGALSVSGSTATNGSGVANGVYDSFIRFNSAAMVAGFDSTFGTNNWVINGAKLRVTEIGAPMNTLFNRGKGRFEVRWITNDNWIEGTGMPQTPTTDGIAYNDEATFLTTGTDMALGTFTNAGANGTFSFPLALAATFISDLRAGGEVGLFLTAVDPGIGFTVDSRSFGTVSSRPFLEISAVPIPGISAIIVSQPNIMISATNGAAGGAYQVLTSTDIALPLNQWTSIATNVLNANGDFTITVTNVNALQQFFILQTQ